MGARGNSAKRRTKDTQLPVTPLLSLFLFPPFPPIPPCLLAALYLPRPPPPRFFPHSVPVACACLGSRPHDAPAAGPH